MVSLLLLPLLLSCGCGRQGGGTGYQLKGISLSPTSLDLLIGEKAQVKAYPSPSVAVPLSFSWESSDPSVVSVSNGEVAALAAGTASVSASYQGKSASIPVTVTAPTPLPPPEEEGEEQVFALTLSGEDCPYAERAEYGFYIPPVEKIRAVLILQHGCGMEQFGLTRHQDLQYQAFARKWGVAVLETAIYGNCGLWGYPEKGSAAGLMKALSKAAFESSHEELTTVPWLLWGHSAGGFWTLGMLRDYPERIIAAVCYSAAWDPAYEYSDAACEVPILLRHAGDQDGDPSSKCKETARHTFQRLRARGAPASIVLNKGQNHNFSYLRTMAIPFWEAALRQRLTDRGLRPLDPDQTWLGDTTTFEIFKETEYSGDKRRMARLPDHASAEAWREFASTNMVKDKTPPPAPAFVKVEKKGASLLITWQALADVESGIARFRVYRDGEQVGTVPSSGIFQNYDLNGDNAIPVPAPEMKLEAGGVPAQPVRIGVETVNRDGLVSERTEVTFMP